MRFYALGLMAAVAATTGGGDLRADPRANAVSAPTVMLNGSTAETADTVQVFNRVWRPYWRGYYQGSSGYSPRPNLLFGPFIYPRFAAYRYPVYRPSYAYYSAPVYYSTPVYAYSYPCSGGVAVASAAPAIVNPAVIAPTAPMPKADVQNLEGAAAPVASVVVPASYSPPPATVEPPLARAPNTTHRLKAPPLRKQASGYSAYGESELSRPVDRSAGAQ